MYFKRKWYIIKNKTKQNKKKKKKIKKKKKAIQLLLHILINYKL